MGRGNSRRRNTNTAAAEPVVEIVEEEPVVEIDTPAAEVEIEEPAAEVIVEEPIQDDAKPAEKIMKPLPIYYVQVTHPSLRKRSGPATTYNTLGYITDKGEYAIYAEFSGWGKLEDGAWIMLTYTVKK